MRILIPAYSPAMLKWAISVHSVASPVSVIFNPADGPAKDAAYGAALRRMREINAQKAFKNEPVEVFHYIDAKRWKGESYRWRDAGELQTEVDLYARIYNEYYGVPKPGTEGYFWDDLTADAPVEIVRMATGLPLPFVNPGAPSRWAAGLTSNIRAVMAEGPSLPSLKQYGASLPSTALIRLEARPEDIAADLKQKPGYYFATNYPDDWQSGKSKAYKVPPSFATQLVTAIRAANLK